MTLGVHFHGRDSLPRHFRNTPNSSQYSPNLPHNSSQWDPQPVPGYPRLIPWYVPKSKLRGIDRMIFRQSSNDLQTTATFQRIYQSSLYLKAAKSAIIKRLTDTFQVRRCLGWVIFSPAPAGSAADGFLKLNLIFRIYNNLGRLRHLGKRITFANDRTKVSNKEMPGSRLCTYENTDYHRLV